MIVELPSHLVWTDWCFVSEPGGLGLARNLSELMREEEDDEFGMFDDGERGTTVDAPLSLTAVSPRQTRLAPGPKPQPLLLTHRLRRGRLPSRPRYRRGRWRSL